MNTRTFPRTLDEAFKGPNYASAVTRFESKPYPKLLWISLVLGLAVALAASLDWI